MAKTIHLSRRLQAVADYIESGAKVIDVGTDHGYIPAYLVQNGIVSHAIASDIRSGPLNAARLSAQSAGVEDKITFTLNDGLPETKGELDTVVIAGMGGETIEHILDNAPWVRDNVRLILQPQSKIDELSNYLDNNGFYIADERIVYDEGKFYLVMLVSFGRSRAPFTCAEMFVDRILMEKRDSLLPDYLDYLIPKLQKAYDGLKKSREPDIVELSRHETALRQLMQMREETEKWQL